MTSPGDELESFESLPVNLTSYNDQSSLTSQTWELTVSNATVQQNFNYFRLINWFDMVENLPVYLAVAFLLVNYGMRSFSKILEKGFDVSDRLKNIGVKQEDYLLSRIKKADQLDRLRRVRSNVHYKYIEHVVTWLDDERCCFFNRLYKYVPHMKYSKHYLNTYTVAFMIVYVFTLFSIRLSRNLGHKLDRIVNFLYELLFESKISAAKSSFSSALYSQVLVYHLEFSLACTLTSAIILVQLLTSIHSFRQDLLSLNRGVNVFSRIKFSKFIKKKKAKLDSVISANSIQFQGYLVYHLV